VAAVEPGRRDQVTVSVPERPVHNGRQQTAAPRRQTDRRGPAADASALTAQAEQAWLQSVEDGAPLTGRQLGEMFGRSDSWGRTVIGACRSRLGNTDDTPSDGVPTTDSHMGPR
jgi:hypothetical protein